MVGSQQVRHAYNMDPSHGLFYSSNSLECQKNILENLHSLSSQLKDNNMRNLQFRSMQANNFCEADSFLSNDINK